MTDSDTKPPQGSPFWRFSLRLYRQPAVADSCIQLQDEAGVDVNILFFLLWLAQKRRAFTPGEVEWIEGKAGPWREATVIPLREVRRALKTPPALVAAPAAEAFRTRIKAVELEAERLQQEALYELAAALPAGEPAASAEAAARTSVASYAEVLAKPFSPPAVEALIAAFATITSAGAT
jgi:uncharacterized protein (TIGR02444 family)